MQQIDQECANSGLPTSVLMENAGKAVAEEVRRIIGTADQQHILVLIGPGNNGGDGLVAARYFHDWGAKVSLYLFGQRPAEDPNLELEFRLDCFVHGQTAFLPASWLVDVDGFSPAGRPSVSLSNRFTDAPFLGARLYHSWR